jgi:hypothetical protein
MFKYKVKTNMPAISREAKTAYVDLPAGTVVSTSQKQTRPLGMIPVISDRRSYVVLAADLLRKCELIPAM